MKTLRLLMPWLAQRRGRLSGSLLLACITVLAGVGLLSVAGWFLTGAFLAGALISFDLFTPSALVRGLSFLRISARYGERIVGHSTTLTLLADIRTAVFGRLMGLNPVQLAQYREGDLVARLVGDIDALDTLFLLVIAPVLTALLMGLVFSVVAGAYVPDLGWIVFAALMTGVCLVPWLLAHFSQTPGTRVQQAASDARALIHDAVAGHTDIVVFSAHQAALGTFREASDRLSQARDRISALGSAGQFAQQLVIGVCVLALLGMGLSAFHAGALTGPVWIGLLLGAIGLFEVLAPLMRGAARLGNTAAAAARVRELLRASPVLPVVREPVVLPRSGVIELSDVHYRYPGPSARYVLDGVSLRVEQGERIAIVGDSGAGKSTLLGLLMRLFDPSDGQVSYGGVAVDTVDIDQLHRRFTLVSQDSPVFLGTVRANLQIGDPEASEARLWAALAQAGLADFVRSLAAGLDTWLGESGRSLSTGQARRLCLARSLLTPATVWVLDEPTAGLDTAAQAAFFADLGRAAAGKTVVLVTHSRIPAGAVDRILRLSAGRLYVCRDGVSV